MSNELWTDERLNQLADLVASNIQAQARHDESIQRIDHRIEKILEAQARHQENIQRHDENIQRIERLVEQNAQASQRNQEDIQRIEHLVESNARVVQALANVSVEAKEERDQLFKRMDQQQAEIVGLRTETARLLDILLNQRNQQDNQN